MLDSQCTVSSFIWSFIVIGCLLGFRVSSYRVLGATRVQRATYTVLRFQKETKSSKKTVWMYILRIACTKKYS
jgi:hypothetical protein